MDKLLKYRTMDANGQVVQTTSYYPFGAHFGESTNSEKQPYKYNSKELDRSYGLDIYDNSARLYDPVIGRFQTMDPLSEKYYSISPYAYCANNPVNNVDLRGDSITTVINTTVVDANGNYGFIGTNG